MRGFVTYQDVIDQCVDYLGGNPSDVVQRDCRRAILEAYRDLANAHRWSYLLTHGRVVTVGPYDDGTVTYDHATRTVTLTDGVWPAWSAGSFLRVVDVLWKVVARTSDSDVVLDELVNPGSDLADPTAYQLFRDTYLLPEDYVGGDQALYERNFGGMSYVHPRDWLAEERYLYAEGTPYRYTIIGDRVWPGRLVLKVSPHPSERKTIDFLYHRRPRALSIATEATGRVAIDIETDASLVTGTGTAFTAAMVGSVLRLSSTGAKPPTAPQGGFSGLNPAAFESVIVAVDSATSLRVADAATVSLAGVQFTVSDPIDVEVGAMMNAFYRCCEMHLSMNRTLKDKPSARLQYERALLEAKSADSRSFAGRSAGDGGVYRQRLRDMPLNLNQE